MLQAIKNEVNLTETENGAKTYASTNDYCLDLFATVGALRNAEDGEIISRFIRAYAENADLAMKILFFARDVRGGLGERRVFRTILSWLAKYQTQSADKNLEYVAEYGRYDDLLVFLGTPCEAHMIDHIRRQLNSDISAMEHKKEVSLLAKWLPSVNATNHKTVMQAKRVAAKLGLSDARYRKTLSALRAYIKIIENNLREKDYTFDYSKQPSRAMFKYRGAFLKNDRERYIKFINDVENGIAQMHTDALMPYDVIAPLCAWGSDGLSEEQKKAVNATWNSLKDYCGGENAIAVIDGSGSMYGWGRPAPIQVALSLGIYFAERNKGEFANRFITFSENPQLVDIKGRDIAEKVAFCKTFCEIANTNIQKVFELILKAAVNSGAAQSELPSTIYIISDMEFDCCTEDADMTNFEYAEKLFARHGYKLPKVVFWNVASRHSQQPVTKNQQGVALVSGCTPRLFDIALNGDLDPYAFMIQTLNAERYKKIAA